MAILNLLQVRGQLTARQVSQELEISERTARRDLDALGQAGVPVYSLQGRNGGWRLAGGGKTDLSGLTAAETRALFLVAGPSSTASPAVRAAIRKLVRALPEPFRESAEVTSERVLVDRDWDGSPARRQPDAPPLLDEAQRLVVEGRQALLGYVARDNRNTLRVIDPLGLACKGARWYLVAHTEAGLRTFRVDRMRTLEETGSAVVRPPDFDLTDAWQLITDAIEEKRAPLVATCSVEPHALQLMRWLFGTRLRIGPSTADGRVAVDLRGHHVHSLAGELAGLGRAVEVHAPEEVRIRLGEIGAELLGHYAPASSARPHSSGA